MLKLIIAGSRDLQLKTETIKDLISAFGLVNIGEIVSGGAWGVDKSGENFAHQHNIKLTIFEADWKKYGSKAGPIRNKEMANYADIALVVHKGTPGSRSMINEMSVLNKPVYEVTLVSHVDEE
jgi:hypothetical protein